MVRVGGGWQYLGLFLKKHDSCRSTDCKQLIFFYVCMYYNNYLFIDSEPVTAEVDLQSLASYSKEAYDKG